MTMSIKGKDGLFEEAFDSSVKLRVSMLDFESLKQRVLDDSVSLAASLNIDQKFAQGFTLSEFAKMEKDVLCEVANSARDNIVEARAKADCLAGKFQLSIHDLTMGAGTIFEKVRSRLPSDEIDADRYPELADFLAQLNQLETESTEQAITISKKFTAQLAQFLRLSYQNELRLVFRQVFIGESEVEALVQFYLMEVPELHLAA